MNKELLEAAAVFSTLAVALAILIHSCDALSTDSPAVAELDRAVIRLVTTGSERHAIAPYPHHPITRDALAREALARACVEAGSAHAVDPWLLLAIAFREGSFGLSTEGALGERSTFQFMPSTSQHVARTVEPRCDLDTVTGAAYCAAGLLAQGREKCDGDLRGAFLRYATGRPACRPWNAKTRWLVRDRFSLAKLLQRIGTNQTDYSALDAGVLGEAAAERSYP